MSDYIPDTYNDYCKEWPWETDQVKLKCMTQDAVNKHDRITALEAELKEARVINDWRMLDDIMRICPDCGDDKCGDNHDVCYKCEAKTLRQALEEVLENGVGMIPSGRIMAEIAKQALEAGRVK